MNVPLLVYVRLYMVVTRLLTGSWRGVKGAALHMHHQAFNSCFKYLHCDKVMTTLNRTDIFERGM